MTNESLIGSRTMNAMSPRLRPLLLTAVALGALALTACTGSGSGSDPGEPASALASPPASGPALAASTATPAAPATSQAAASFDRDVFCERAEPLLTPVAREFVGSDAHVEQFVTLSEVAPEDLRGVIDRMGEFYRTSVSPEDPDSQNWDNFPASVQADAIALVDGIEGVC